VKLHAYQEDGVRYLAERNAALLADVPGLGKTAQAIRACDEVDALRVLVLCPAVVVENWKAEIARWRRGFWSATVVSIDTAKGRLHTKLVEKQWDVLIVDEAHMAKNPKSIRAHALYGRKETRNKPGMIGIASRADRVWLLTGTPLPNNGSEIWTHLHALRPDLILSRNGRPQTFFQFTHANCKVTRTGFGEKIGELKNPEKFRARLEGFMLRRRAEDQLDLPPLRHGMLALGADASELQGPKAEEMRRALDEDGLDGLKKLAPEISTLRRLTARLKAKPIAQWVKQWKEDRPLDEKLIVMVWHHDLLRSVRDAIGVGETVFIGGDQSSPQRESAVRMFQDEPHIRFIVVQIKAGGVGVTLTRAREMVMAESSYTPADNHQAIKRIHRIGQRHSCMVHWAYVPGSIDEAVQQTVMEKTRDIGAVMDREMT
jgi:SWI/SNF-related matrix-associated actin-dependent regulator 1 of chromatin subfamily A